VGVDLAEFRSALMPFSEEFDWNDESTVRAKIPAANGQFTARSLARMYAMLAGEGALDGVRVLSRKTVRELASIQNNTRDKVLFLPMKWRLGYHRAFTLGATAPQAFGHYGYGGSGGFCDLQRDLAVGFTVNYGAGTPTGDSRMPRIARSAIRAVDRISA
jgi:CubicO group peptidase (beta-lactamase class C family)